MVSGELHERCKRMRRLKEKVREGQMIYPAFVEEDCFRGKLKTISKLIFISSEGFTF